METKCCGTCKWNEYESASDDWTCTNSNSEYYTDYTGYRDTCEEWEMRE